MSTCRSPTGRSGRRSRRRRCRARCRRAPRPGRSGGDLLNEQRHRPPLLPGPCGWKPAGFWTATDLILASSAALSWCWIFIASSTIKVWPRVTLSPAATLMATMRPSIGARSLPSLPASAVAGGAYVLSLKRTASASRSTTMSSPSIWKRTVSSIAATSSRLTASVRSTPPTASLIGVGSGLELRQPRKAAG